MFILQKTTYCNSKSIIILAKSCCKYIFANFFGLANFRFEVACQMFCFSGKKELPDIQYCQQVTFEQEKSTEIPRNIKKKVCPITTSDIFWSKCGKLGQFLKTSIKSGIFKNYLICFKKKKPNNNNKLFVRQDFIISN